MYAAVGCLGVELMRGTAPESRDPCWSEGVRAGVGICRARGQRGYCPQVDSTVERGNQHSGWKDATEASGGGTGGE